MNAKPDERQADIVDRAVDALRGEPVPSTPADVVAAAVSAGLQTTDPIGPAPIRRRIWTMKNMTRFAVAAVIIAGAIGGIIWLTVGSGGATIAWADVQKHIGGITSMRYRGVMTGESIPDMEMWMMMKSPGKMRQEMEMAGHTVISIIDIDRGEMITLSPGEMRAVRFELHSMPEEQLMAIQQQDMLSHFRKLAEASPDGLEELPPCQIDGRQANVYRVEHMGQTFTIWADAYTGRPIEMEVTMEATATTMIMTDFEFDVDMDDSLFSTAIPQGYKVQEMTMDASGPSIDSVVELLRRWTDASGGAFPDSMDAISIAREGERIFPEDLSKDEQLELTMVLTRAFMIITTHPESRYMGKGHSLGDAEAPIFWYQPAKDVAYQVVYGDLRIEEVAEENLPEAPAEQKATIDDVVALLRRWTDASGGAFPDALDFFSLAKQINNDFPEISRDEKLELTLGWQTIIANHLEARYVGKGRSLGDAEAPIFWYQPETDGAYQVVYGDLRVEDVAEEDLPEVPAEVDAEAVPSP